VRLSEIPNSARKNENTEITKIHSIHVSLCREFGTTMPTMTFPLPVSTNRLWRAGRGRVYRSPQYRAWVTEAGRELRAQRSKSVTGPVAVTIAAGRQDRRPRDIDNLGKASLDLLVEHRVLADDNRLPRALVRRPAPGRVVVSIAAAN